MKLGRHGKGDAVIGVREEFQRFAAVHQRELRFGWRLTLLLAFVAIAIYLSTLELGDDPQSESFEGAFFSGLIPWAVVAFAGVVVVGWLRQEKRRYESKRADRQ